MWKNSFYVLILIPCLECGLTSHSVVGGGAFHYLQYYYTVK